MVGDDDCLPGALKRFDLTLEFCNLIRFVFTPDKDTTERFDNNHVGVKPTAVKLVKEFGSHPGNGIPTNKVPEMGGR